jgi:hypothetical protein
MMTNASVWHHVGVQAVTGGSLQSQRERLRPCLALPSTVTCNHIYNLQHEGNSIITEEG